MQALFLNPRISLWPIDRLAAQRGADAAQAGDWPRAIEAFQVAHHQRWSEASIAGQLLLAQAAGGDAEGARRTLADLAGRLAKTKYAEDAAALFRWSPAVPWDGQAAAALLAHARGQVARRRSAFSLHYCGAALYRAGRYAEAEKTLAESVKAQGKGGYVDTWLFQALTAHRLGKHQEAEKHLARLRPWYDKQTFSDWKSRTSWRLLMAEARKLIETPPRMPKVPADG